MHQDNYCPSCKVRVSGDLCNCPLCGKHIRDKKDISENNNSYPIYDTKFVQTATWYGIIRALFCLAGVVVTIINLIFKTTPYYFPYVLSGLFMIFMVFIKPIKVTVRSYIKNLVIMSIFVSLFLIFVDAYNHFSFDTPFGWSLSYVCPFVMLAGVVASAIICFYSSRYERELLREVAIMALVSVIFFIVQICFFKNLKSWASLSLMCASVGLVVVLELFKRHKLINELSREFHL